MPVVILVGGLIIAGIIGLRALSLIAVGAKSITVRVDQTVPLGLALVYKPWFRFSFRLVPGTIRATTGTAVFSVAPAAQTTVGNAPYGSIDITGISVGTGTIRIMGASNEGTHDAEVINVTVIA
jgi:hypothetical protein